MNTGHRYRVAWLCCKKSTVYLVVQFLPHHSHSRSRCWASFPRPSSGRAGSHYPPDSGNPWEIGLGQGHCLWSLPACCHQYCRREEKREKSQTFFLVIKFQTKSPESNREELRIYDDSFELGQGHLHAVPGGEVFVYDLPASQVAHSTCNLDGHVNQVLLRDCLKGNKGERETLCSWKAETGKTTKREEWGQETIADVNWRWRNWSSVSNCSYFLRIGTKSTMGQRRELHTQRLFQSLNSSVRVANRKTLLV